MAMRTATTVAALPTLRPEEGLPGVGEE